MSEKEIRKKNQVRRPNAEHSRDRGRPGRASRLLQRAVEVSPPSQGLAACSHHLWSSVATMARDILLQ
jgi:hypothetical protein